MGLKEHMHRMAVKIETNEHVQKARMELQTVRREVVLFRIAQSNTEAGAAELEDAAGAGAGAPANRADANVWATGSTNSSIAAVQLSWPTNVATHTGTSELVLLSSGGVWMQSLCTTTCYTISLVMPSAATRSAAN
jgi:hypothetical protein